MKNLANILQDGTKHELVTFNDNVQVAEKITDEECIGSQKTSLEETDFRQEADKFNLE